MGARSQAGRPAGRAGPTRPSVEKNGKAFGKHAPPAVPGSASTLEGGKVMAEAFLSVHDMIHAAIRAQGDTASLRQIYAASQARGRIIYKRAGGSRLITSNEHWKSQIRHALYTSGRFRRAPGSTDEWQMAEGFGADGPSTALIEVSVGEERRQSAENAARVAAKKGSRGAKLKAEPNAGGAPKRHAQGEKKKVNNNSRGNGNGKNTSGNTSCGASREEEGAELAKTNSGQRARVKSKDEEVEAPGASDQSNQSPVPEGEQNRQPQQQQVSGPTAESTPPPSHRSRDSSPGVPPPAPLSERNGGAPGRRRGGKRRGAPGPAGPASKRAAPALAPVPSDSETGGHGGDAGGPPHVGLPVRLEAAVAAPGAAMARAPSAPGPPAPAAAAAAAAAAWTVAALMEEEAVDARELLKLSPMEAQAFTHMLLAYDRSLALRVQGILEGAGAAGAPPVRVSGVAKVMVTTFLHSVACQRSLRSAVGAHLVRPVPQAPGGTKRSAAANLAAAANSQLSAATTLGELSKARSGLSGPASGQRARA